MNDYNFTSLLMITCGALLGVSIGIFAYGSDFWTSTGIGCALAACVAVSEISPMFDWSIPTKPHSSVIKLCGVSFIISSHSGHL